MSSTAISSVEYAREQRRRDQLKVLASSQERERREEAIKQQREEEALYTTSRILCGYDAYFLTLLQSWLGVPYRLDPLRSRDDFYSLMEYLARKRVTYCQEEESGFFTVIVQMNVAGGWKTGRATGDTLAEALVFAVWEMIENG
jgi:hypothetical protein